MGTGWVGTGSGPIGKIGWVGNGCVGKGGVGTGCVGTGCVGTGCVGTGCVGTGCVGIGSGPIGTIGPDGAGAAGVDTVLDGAGLVRTDLVGTDLVDFPAEVSVETVCPGLFKATSIPAIVRTSSIRTFLLVINSFGFVVCLFGLLPAGFLRLALRFTSYGPNRFPAMGCNPTVFRDPIQWN